MWLQLNKFYLMVTAATENFSAQANPHEYFIEVKNANHLFNGIATATMTHGEPWHFFENVWSPAIWPIVIVREMCSNSLPKREDWLKGIENLSRIGRDRG